MRRLFLVTASRSPANSNSGWSSMGASSSAAYWTFQPACSKSSKNS
jgi:hypothetical protein